MEDVGEKFVLNEFDPVWGSQYMQPFLWLIILGLLFSAAVGFAMGANDVANSFGTSVGARVLSLKQACFLAGVFNFLGAMVLGAPVTETIKSGIVQLSLFVGTPHVYMAAMVAAYVGTFSLVMGATVFKMPVSTTHAVVGGVLGASLAAYGDVGVDWFGVAMVATGWVAAPVFAGIFTAAFYLTQQRILEREEDREKQRNKQTWYASFQVGLIAWMLAFFVSTKVIDPIPDWLKVSKLGKDQKPLTWPGSLALPLLCFGVMGVVMLFSRYLLIPGIFSAIEKDHAIDAVDAKDGEEKLDEAANEIKALEAASDAPVSDQGTKATATAEGKTSTKRCGNSDLFTLNHEDKPYALERHVTTKAAALHEAADTLPKEIEVRFKGIQVISASFMALSHGANDIANVVGPISGCLEAWNDGTLSKKAPANYGILAFGGAFIVLGLATFGARVMATIGHNTTKISPSRGVNVELGAAFAVTIASYLGIPTSTTQCVMGSIIAVGLCNKERHHAVDFRLFGVIFVTWVLTPLVSGLISAAAFELFNAVAENQVPDDLYPLNNESEMYGVRYGFTVYS